MEIDENCGTPLGVLRPAILSSATISIEPSIAQCDGMLVCVDEEKLDDHEKREIYLDKRLRIEPLPVVSHEKQNTRLFVVGPSGSGKSTFVRQFFKNYRKINPDKKIYYISRLSDDPAFASIPMTKINCNSADILKYKPPDFKDSIVLMDDFECLHDKEHLTHTYHIRNTLLETGRHQNSDIIIVSHTMLNSAVSKLVHLESNLVCVFPKSNFSPIHAWLRRYLGVTDKQVIEKIRTLPSRWVMFRRQYPTAVMYERGVFLL